MKYILLPFLLVFISCKSQNALPIVEEKKVYNSEVIEELTKVSQKKDTYYIMNYFLPEKKIHVIVLNICNDCYLSNLLTSSKDIIILNNNKEVKILNKEDVDNFEINDSEEHMMHTGGSFFIELDSNYKILKKYFA